MDVLIAFCLLLVSVLLTLRRPLQLSLLVTHKYDYGEAPVAPNHSPVQKELDETDVVNMDQVMRVLQDAMGVNDHAD